MIIMKELAGGSIKQFACLRGNTDKKKLIKWRRSYKKAYILKFIDSTSFMEGHDVKLVELHSKYATVSLNTEFLKMS